MPALREIHPAAEQNIIATAEELREESALLDSALQRGARAQRRGRRSAGGGVLGAGRPAGSAAASGPAPPGRAGGGRPRSARPGARCRVGAPGARPRQLLHRSARRSAGGLRVRRDPLPQARAANPIRRRSSWPCRAAAGSDRGWCCASRARPARRRPRSPDEALLDRARLADRLEVRAWRPGDRMRPIGLDGTKSSPGPVHRSEDPALAALARCRSCCRPGRSPGSAGWRSRRTSRRRRREATSCAWRPGPCAVGAPGRVVSA